MLGRRRFALALGSLLLAARGPSPARAQDGDTPPPDPPVADDPWPLIAYRRVRASGQAVLRVDTGDGHVSHVRFQAQDRGVVVEEARFELVGAVEPLVVRPRERLRPGTSGDTIELPAGAELRLVRVRFQLLGSSGVATLNLLGERAP